MKNSSLSPQETSSRYTSEDKEKRYKALGRLFGVFRKNFCEMCDGIEICYDPEVLFNCVESFYIDINRFHTLHQITIKDDIKRAAYTAKWLVKNKPVYCPDRNLEDMRNKKFSDKVIMVNELFSVFVVLSFLKIRPPEVDKAVFRLLLYTLKYRPFDEGMFMLFLHSLRICVHHFRKAPHAGSCL
jgi:hypothetical protein